MAVSLKSSSSRWAKSGEGQSWKQGSSVTARFLFLKYCNGLQQQQGSSAELNKKMGDGYSDNFFGFVEAQKSHEKPISNSSSSCQKHQYKTRSRWKKNRVLPLGLASLSGCFGPSSR
ncbi:unnamed protein product [Prunus armeniaca]